MNICKTLLFVLAMAMLPYVAAGAGKPLFEIDVPLQNVVLATDGSALCGRTDDGEVILGTDDGKKTTIVPTTKDFSTTYKFSDDNQLLVASNPPAFAVEVYSRDKKRWKSLRTIAVAASRDAATPTTLAFVGKSILVSCGGIFSEDEVRVRSYNAFDGKFSAVSAESFNYVVDIAVVPEKKVVLLSTGESVVALDLGTLKVKYELPIDCGMFTTSATANIAMLSGDGGLSLLPPEFRTQYLKMWRLDDGKEVVDVHLETRLLREPKLNADGKLLAMATEDGRILVKSLKEKTTTTIKKGEPVVGIAWMGDKLLVARVQEGKTIVESISVSK